MSKINNLFFLSFLFFAQTTFAVKYQFNGRLDSRFKSYTENMNSPMGMRLNGMIEQVVNMSDTLKSQIQLIGNANSYSIEGFQGTSYKPTKDELFEFYSGESYLHWQVENFLMRVGYQQVVWGDAFGVYYSDFINPKDLKESFFSSSDLIRRSLPMLNMKLINSDFSTQVIVGFQPGYNKMPPITRYLGTLGSSINNLEVEKEKQPEPFKKYEGGLKISTTIGNTDLSLYGYDYYDRSPYYTLKSLNVFTSTLSLTENHDHITTAGLSGASAIGSYITRFEFLYTRNRNLNTLAASTLASEKSDERAGVLSIETPRVWNSIFTLQYSESHLLNPNKNFLRAGNQSTTSFRVSYGMAKEREVNFIMAYFNHDKGGVANIEYFEPKTENLEMRLGIETYFGPKDSEMGSNTKENGIYIGIRNYFKS